MKDPSETAPVLVIGVHREELAFGDEVAARLAPSEVRVLRIPEGLSGRRPRQDELFRYEILHRELYRQLLGQMRGRYPMVLDLHCGLDEEGLSADLITRDLKLLACVSKRARIRFGRLECDKIVRPVLLDGESAGLSDRAMIPGRTVIPQDVWKSQAFDYVGIEVFLRSRGSGSQEEWDLACWLIRAVAECRGLALKR